MFTLLWLSLLGASELPQVALKELPQVIVTVPKAPKYIVRKLPRPAGYHEHQCSFCGMRWGHGGNSFGHSSDHSCPKCGRMQWTVAPGIRLPQKEVKIRVQ